MSGVVRLSFLIRILDDPLVEDNEMFQLVLQTPEGGGSLGAQFRANVTILDNDRSRTSASLTTTLIDSVHVVAGESFVVPLKAYLADGYPQTIGGEVFYAVVENDFDLWINPGTPSGSQRNSPRLVCSIFDNGNGVYNISGVIHEQGNYAMQIWYGYPGGLKGEYYTDANFGKRALWRIDETVNFTWGDGVLMPLASDYVTIRWSGLLRIPPTTGYYYFAVASDDEARLWINGNLVLDHWHAQYVGAEPPRPVYLQGNTLVEIILEFREIRGTAYLRLLWGPSPTSMSVIAQKYLYSLWPIQTNQVNISVRSFHTVGNTTECFGDGLYVAKAGVMSTFQFCPRDVYLNMRDDDDEFYLSTELFGASLSVIDDGGHQGDGAEVLWPVLTYDHGTHCFQGTYTPTKAGLYKLDIWYQSRSTMTIEPLLGSPFYVNVAVTYTSGPYSVIIGLGKPQLGVEVGTCFDFEIISRDLYRNYRFIGGDDFEVRNF